MNHKFIHLLFTFNNSEPDLFLRYIKNYCAGIICLLLIKI